MASPACLKCTEDSLVTKLTALLSECCYPGHASQTVSRMFETFANHLEAERAGLFLLWSEGGSNHLETICTVGFMEQQLDVLETGKRPGDGATVRLWDAVDKQMKTPHVVRNKWDLQRVEPDLAALCVPVRDPVLNVPIAVLYFEKHGTFEISVNHRIRHWMELFVLALQQAFHLARSRDDKLEIPKEPPTLITGKHSPELVGDSMQTEALRQHLHEIYIPAAGAPDPEPILILGDKGTGKDLVARYIYACSTRQDHPYIAVNCAEITDELAAARFFGHKKGSFTGSLANEPGFFRAADRGVLFLDEIGDLSLRSQSTLLRVLENRTIVPLGETKETKVDVQVILATNCDPERAVAEGRIRQDLLDRFKTQQIRLVPLRERPSDIPPLVRHFLLHHQRRMRKKILGMHPDVLKTMVGYSWPGNVREVARVCSLLIAHARPGELIDTDKFAKLVPYIMNEELNPKASALLVGNIPLRDALEAFERELILSRLRQNSWNIRSARESLGLPKTTFHRYTRSLGIANLIRERGSVDDNVDCA